MYEFQAFDKFLLSLKGKIIHQVWFDTIQSKRKTKQAYTKFLKYKQSWEQKNKSWQMIEWNKVMCLDLIKTHYTEHFDLFKNYKHEIQRCDAARYFILHRYGGFYVDMDVECLTSADIIRAEYPKKIYLAETGNQAFGTRVSNLMMYAEPDHPFWKQLFLELYAQRESPFYYTKHLEIMYSTGPAFLNKCFYKFGSKYKLDIFPFEKFNPLFLGRPIYTVNKSLLHTLHYGCGSWESSDSKIIIFFYCNWRLVIFIILVMLIPYIFEIISTPRNSLSGDVSVVKLPVCIKNGVNGDDGKH